MSIVLTTLKKELMSYFFSPVGYIIAVLFYLFRGVEVSSLVTGIANLGGSRDDFAMAYTLQNSSYFMIILVPPILTMRCFAEERRTGSFEVLMTAPVRDWEIVVGKWLASVSFFLILWMPTLLILFLLGGDSYLATELHFGPVISGYLGLALVGSMMLAVGCFASSLTENILLAALSALLFNLAFIAAPRFLAPYLGSFQEDYHLVRVMFEQINIPEQLSLWFARGLIDSSQVLFYLSGTFFFLFLTTRSLEARKWQ